MNKEKLKIMSNAIRALSIDAIEKANSGHPGLPLGMADVATVLFSKFLKFDPSKPEWLDRDRFVLSAGHGSMLLYALSYLVGYKDCSLNQLRNFRQLGSKTAGHPEFGLLKSIETTTGPLGQGLANAVGMAISEKVLNQKYGNIFNHKTWVVAGDGCLMEGISQEAISMAGHLKLKNLIVFFDDNKISIDGPTNLTCSDNQKERFEASNWHTIEINGHSFKEIEKGINEALKSSKPSLIICRTIIGFGSPNKSGKETVHGAPLGAEELKLTKKRLDWPYKSFFIPNMIIKNWRKIGINGKKKRLNWEKKYNSSKHFLEIKKQFKKRKVTRDNDSISFLSNILKNKKDEATRKSSLNSLEFFSSKIENFMGGSADLTGSNLTKTKNSRTNKNINYIHYGVREHLMAAAMNGIAVHGGFIPYGGTFLVFSDYCKNAIRLSAMMKQQVIYVFTHDSIGLGEDGPTHQPIEHLVALRSIPGLTVLRPSDAIETFEAWEIALNNFSGPSAIILSRQNLPLIRNNFKNNESIKGGYLIKSNANSKFTIISTGSEVSLGLEVLNHIKQKFNIDSNLVSMPSLELFDNQNKNYQKKILGNKPKIVIEAGSGYSWYKYLEQKDLIVSIDKFGESGKAKDLYNYFGFNCKNIVELIKKNNFL